MTTTHEGIDVSKYQAGIDWTAVKAAGKEFAYIRSGYGTKVDPWEERDIAGAKAAGLVLGTYHYVVFSADPMKQVDIMAAQHTMMIHRGLVLRPALDVEETSGQSKEKVVEVVRLMRDELKKRTGKVPFLYTGKGFWNALPASDLDGSMPLWVAQWGVTSPTLPRGWDKWTVWQYSEKGSVPGIQGTVDLNRWNGNPNWYDKRPAMMVAGAAIGAVLGGPVGAAAGGAVGLAIDHVRKWRF